MALLTDSDYGTFEKLCGLSQKAIKKTLSHYLRTIYPKVVENKEYIFAEGDIPVALVAHMDTVFQSPPHDIYYDRIKEVIWSPQGLGADDRAGVYGIIRLLRSGLRPHVIFTTDEEKGGWGASALISDYEKPPFKDLRYIIELDRQGEDECVFYWCDNGSFSEYIESFGFITDVGSFSDISIICEQWGVAGVNLSIGYVDEHSKTEILHIDWMMRTLKIVAGMLKESDIPYFEYIKAELPKYYQMILARNMRCYHCDKPFDAYDGYPVFCKDGRYHNWCIDCVASPELIKWDDEGIANEQ